jgi:hypothetical protein
MFDPAIARIDAVVDEYENACRSGPPPCVSTYLDQVPEIDRPALLRELVKLELEYHYQAGESNSVEECLRRHPELESNTSFVLDLIVLEWRLDRAAGRALVDADYQKRFPHLHAKLTVRLASLNNRARFS